MREVHRSQFQLGQVPVEKVWINPKSRDDIPAVLKGLQHIWCDEALRARLFVLLDEHILPEADRTVGRPGMDLWQILVLGVLKQGLGCDFDRLHDLTNHHQTIRAFLGHGDFDDKTRYESSVAAGSCRNHAKDRAQAFSVADHDPFGLDLGAQDR